MSENTPQLPPILTDRYRIVRQIGQGGMATVYLAEDLKLERQVALKVLRPELGAVLGTERFLAEVKITARLDHPHILTLIDSGAADGLLYYVLPYVRGESLRDLLDREQQLSVEHACTITRHIASALDYAHRQGVIHRDIKPENILLQEGEAMLADFGIALAVKEAGGNRLTETGLSLGTPQYMSPEQATGERMPDARSDVYSLAAVLYEMLTGDPPITGKTVQSVVAKLLTEAPTPIRTVRPNVPEALDLAVQRALSKIPADRHASPGEFVRAIGHVDATTLSQAGVAAASMSQPVPVTQATPSPRRARNIGMLIGAAATVTTIIVLGANGTFAGKTDYSATLRERTQLTFTGRASIPTLSEDGKQLAYFTKECEGASCSYGVDVQDVGATVTRRVLDGVSAAYWLGWSPDRRNLLVNGTINGRYGTFLVSALGGAPRFLTAGSASFYAGGDSLLVGDVRPRGDSTFIVRVMGLAGRVVDSVALPVAGTTMNGLTAIPGSSRFVALVIQPPRGLWMIVERDGKVVDRLLNDCTCGGTASHDALWMARAGPTVTEAIVRVAFDASGKLASHQDTIYNGSFSNLSVTQDGLQLAVDDGSVENTVVAGSLADFLRGSVPGGPALLQASTPVGADISPDGARLLMQRRIPGADGVLESRLSVRDYAGGEERPLAVTGRLLGFYWVDSVSAALISIDGETKRMTIVDVRSGNIVWAKEMVGEQEVNSTALPDGWAWLPPARDRIIVERDGRRTEIRKPAWLGQINAITASADGSRLVMTGWNASTEDSLGVYVVPTSGGTPVRWDAQFAEFGYAQWLDDGSVLFANWVGPESVSLFQIAGPGRVKPLGSVPRRTRWMTFDTRLQRATMRWRDERSDAWMYRVVKP